MSEGIKFDADKPNWALLPLGPLEVVVKVLDHGAKKYGAFNWVQVESAEERYFAATMRHLAAWQSLESVDPESGLSHLAHAACNLIFMLWFEENNKVLKSRLPTQPEKAVLNDD